MPRAVVRGVDVAYEVLGRDGPWMALSPGGRRPKEVVKQLAGMMADKGYRVVIYDRRNCGAADVAIEGEESEYEAWADDLHALLGKLGALPAIIGGASSGCRLSVLFTLRHPEAVRALLLWRVTGGKFAAERLAENYYGQFIRAAREGGMKAVCEMEHFADLISARPSNRDKLMAMDASAFIDVMSHWREYFLAGAELPIIGATETDLRSIRVPTIVVPGNDKTHGIATGRLAQSLIPNSELYELFTEQTDEDLFPIEEWDKRDGEMAAAFADFLKRRLD